MADKKTYLGDELTLDQWIKFMKESPKDVNFEHYMFPTDSLREEFIRNIHDYDEALVKKILHAFLDFGVVLGSDKIHLRLLMQRLKEDPEKTKELIKEDPYSRRLIASIQSGGKIPVHDSILWVIDILDIAPRNALNVIDAFLAAHIDHLPDGRISGLDDAERIIRARYFGAKTDSSVLHSLKPREFENVVEALYYERSYKTQMTKHSYDNGRDVIALKDDAGEKEKVVISCKRISPQKTVRAVDVREALAPVTKDRATKGVLVTTGLFSEHSYKYAKDVQLELIDQGQLQKLLNKYLGVNWSAHLDYYISNSNKRHPKEKRI